MWSAFTEVIIYAVNLYVPIKTAPKHLHRSQKRFDCRYPKEICKAFATKLRCWRRYKAQSDNFMCKIKYQKCARLCNELVRNYAQKCEARVLDVCNIGSFYRFVNKRLGNKTGICPLHDGSKK